MNENDPCVPMSGCVGRYHTWTWAGGNTSDTEPIDGSCCTCGAYVWHRRKERMKEPHYDGIIYDVSRSFVTVRVK